MESFRSKDQYNENKTDNSLEIRLETHQNSSETEKNSITYSSELFWLNNLIEARFKQHFSNKPIEKNSLNPPDLSNDDSKYANWVKKLKLNDFERLVVISSLAYQYSSNIFDKLELFNSRIKFFKFSSLKKTFFSKFFLMIEQFKSISLL